MNEDLPKVPIKIKVLYALGQFGWSLCSFAALNCINYFFIPPETSEASVFPTFINQSLLFGVLTIIGILTLGGRVFDAFTDPLIASWSDRNKSKLGKRRFFLAWSAIPFALFSVLIFVPITNTASSINVVWLALCLFLFFFFMTAYVVPYTAWLSELGHNKDERLNLSTYISITWALGFAVGQFVYLLAGNLESILSKTQSFQAAVAILSAISLVFMLVPVFFIDEKKYALAGNSSSNAFASLKQVWRDSNFRTFVFSDLFYWMALTAIQSGIVYYVTILLKEDASQATFYGTIMFLISFLLYVPINKFTKNYGKKIMVNFAFVVFGLVFFLIYFLGIENLPIAGNHLFTAILVLAAFPLAIFGILPNAIVSDMANENAIENGEQKAGMYFGLRMLMMKIGVAITNLVFPSLLLLGKSTANDFGVRITAIYALVACILGFLVFRFVKLD